MPLTAADKTQASMSQSWANAGAKAMRFCCAVERKGTVGESAMMFSILLIDDDEV
jgi:hypothetical protein